MSAPVGDEGRAGDLRSDEGGGSQRVDVAFAGPARQNRLTVAFRIILAVPHVVVLMVFTVLTEVVVFVGWFAALILGRLPAGMADFVARVVQYGARVSAYTSLLTDRYPPFDLGARDYPVAADIRPGPLNRLAVLFRLFLAVPASFMAGLVRSGSAVAGFFVWLIVLITGRVPNSLYQALAAVLRFETRYYAYLALVTSEYPWGLFGDRASGPGGEASAPAPSWDPGTTPPIPAVPPAPYWDPTAAGPASPPPPPPPPVPPVPGVTPYWDPTGTAPPPPAAPAPPPSVGASGPLATRLVLTRAARRTVGLFVFLGVLWVAAYVSVVAVVAGSAGARIQLNDAYSQLASAVSRFQDDSAACRTGVGPMDCEEAAVRRLAPAFATFSSGLDGIDFPGPAQADAAALKTDSDQMQALLDRMGSARTPVGYLVQARQFEVLGNRFDDDYRRLQADLS